MPDPRQVHSGATRLLSLLMLAIGVGLLVEAVIGHHGVQLVRLLLAVLFLAAGAARLYVEARRRGPR
jgi:hypothetical protein